MELIAGYAPKLLERRLALTASLFTVTILPIAYYFCVEGWPQTQPDFASFIVVIGALGVTHVGMTSYFYVADSRFTNIISENKNRYYLLPALAFVVALAVFWRERDIAVCLFHGPLRLVAMALQ